MGLEEGKVEGVGVYFCSEDGDRMFLRNVSIYTAPKPRRTTSSSRASWSVI
jgi:hypothetical protein